MTLKEDEIKVEKPISDIDRYAWSNPPSGFADI